jgi:predicted DNA-binding protein (MmcQ/YjbR family)
VATRPAPTPGKLTAAAAQLRDHALSKPEATEHFPWGERAIKVKGKVFLFMHSDAGSLSLSTKLPESAAVALLLPFANPTGYGLGKAGWVSAEFSPTDRPPVDMLCSWIDESYQAVAPAKLASLARGDASPAAALPLRPAARKPARKPAKKPAARKPAKKPAARKPAQKPAARKPAAKNVKRT